MKGPVSGHSVADSHFFKFILSTIVAHRDKLEGQEHLNGVRPGDSTTLIGEFHPLTNSASSAQAPLRQGLLFSCLAR
jgi:hypothetical protein